MLKKSITKANSITFLRRYWHVLLPLAITFVAAAYIAYVTRHMLNPDGVSYIEVARYYADFNIAHAINGYWSPLVSWLLTPSFWLGLDPLYTFRALNAALAVLIVALFLAVLNWHKRVSTQQQLLQAIFVSGVGILAATWSGFLVTPDLLSAAVMLLALLCLTRFQQQPSTNIAIAAGILLAMVYFAKSVGFYVSVTLVAFTLGRAWIQTRNLPRPHLLLAATFAALVIPWIAAISLKYDKFTVSTAGSYNFALIGPDRPAHPQTIPDYTLMTHYESDIWAWSDPSYFSMPQWRITDHIHYYYNYLLKNIPRTVQLLVVLSPFVILGALAAIQRRQHAFAFASLLSAAILLTAYGLVIVEDRHLWQAAIPLLFCAIYYIQRDEKRLKPFTVLSAILLFVYIVPNYLATARDTAVTSRGLGELRLLSLHTDASMPDGSTVAGYDGQHIVCFYTRTRCIGNYRIKASNAAAVLEKMRADKIQYYIEPAAPRDIGLPIVHTETLNTQTSLTVYKL